MSNVNLDSLQKLGSAFELPDASEANGPNFEELSGGLLKMPEDLSGRFVGGPHPHPIIKKDEGFGIPGDGGEEGFTIYDVPEERQQEMAPIFRLYSGDVPGEGDGVLSREDMKAAIDDGVVSFGFKPGGDGLGLQIDLDNIPWEKISTFLTTFTGGVEGEDIHAGTFVDAIEWLMGGNALGVEFDDLDVQMLTELHGELTGDGLEGASAIELALLLQSEEYSLESLLPPPQVTFDRSVLEEKLKLVEPAPFETAFLDKLEVGDANIDPSIFEENNSAFRMPNLAGSTVSMPFPFDSSNVNRLEINAVDGAPVTFGEMADPE